MENAELINSKLSQWVERQNRDDVFRILQKAGVPCGPMLVGMEMLDNVHLCERGWNLEIDQPGVGYMKLEGPAWESENMGGPLTYPSPDLAEHTVEIASEILKMDSAAIESLIERGILEI